MGDRGDGILEETPVENQNEETVISVVGNEHINYARNLCWNLLELFNGFNGADVRLRVPSNNIRRESETHMN